MDALLILLSAYAYLIRPKQLTFYTLSPRFHQDHVFRMGEFLNQAILFFDV